VSRPTAYSLVVVRSRKDGIDRARESRDAGPPVRGYLYQVDMTLISWLDLDEDVELHVEATDDFEERARTFTRVTAVRQYAQRLNLKKDYFVESLAWFAEVWQCHPHRHQFRYLTTATASRERGFEFDLAANGVETWNRLRTEELPTAQTEADLKRLMDVLTTAIRVRPSGAKGLPDASKPILAWFATYLEGTEPSEFHKLIRAVDIATASVSAAEAEALVIAHLVERFPTTELAEGTRLLRDRLTLFVLRQIALDRTNRQALTRGRLESEVREFEAHPVLSPADREALEAWRTTLGPRHAVLSAVPAELRAHLTELGDSGSDQDYFAIAQSLDATGLWPLARDVREQAWLVQARSGRALDAFDGRAQAVQQDLRAGRFERVFADDAALGALLPSMSDADREVRQVRLNALMAVAHWFEAGGRPDSIPDLIAAANMLSRARNMEWADWALLWLAEFLVAERDLTQLARFEGQLRALARRSRDGEYASATRARLALAELRSHRAWLSLSRRGGDTAAASAILHARHGRFLAWNARRAKAEQAWNAVYPLVEKPGLLGERREAVHSTRQLRARLGEQLDRDTLDALSAQAVERGRATLLAGNGDALDRALPAFADDRLARRAGDFQALRSLRHALWASVTSGHFGTELWVLGLLAEYHLRSQENIAGFQFDLRRAIRYAVLAGDPDRIARAVELVHARRMSPADTLIPRDFLTYMDLRAPWCVSTALELLARVPAAVDDGDAAKAVGVAMNILSQRLEPITLEGALWPVTVRPAVDIAALLALAAFADRVPPAAVQRTLDRLQEVIRVGGLRPGLEVPEVSEATVRFLVRRAQVDATGETGARIRELLHDAARSPWLGLRTMAEAGLAAVGHGGREDS
jgi:hypothetical protein